jgi:V-type H+-transporting ATPase subunit a
MPQNDDGKFCVYPFGMDPVWKLSEYDIQEFNGVKMKLSVILGVMLMELGIICKMVNARYRKNSIEMLEAIAMFLMLFLLFGMMDILIFAKWLYPTNIDATGTVEWNKDYFAGQTKADDLPACVPYVEG